MARLWTCGFELQSAAALVEIQDSNGSPTVSTSIHRPGGLAALRITPTGPTQYVEMQLTSGVVMRTFHRFYLYITALPATDTNIYGVGQSGYFPAVVRLTTTGALQLRDNQALINLGPATAPLALGQWHRIELDYTDTAGTVAAGAAPFRGYLNGTLFADAMCSNTNGFSRVRMGAIQAASGMDICIDDVAVNDDTGNVQNSLPGAGTVVHLHPAGAGDANGWTTAVGGTAGAANNWTRVTEVTPDDATSYNETTATGTTATDDFTLSSASAAGIGATDAIRLVAVGARVGSTATTAASIVTRIKGQSGGTLAESPSTSVAVNGWTTHKSAVPRLYQLTTYANPQTGAAWTRAALGTAQIGYRANVSQTTVRRVTTLWALVEYARPENAVQLGAAREHDAVLPVRASRTVRIRSALATATAWPLTLRHAAPIRTARTAVRAGGIGHARAVLLGAASETATAEPLSVRRRAPLSTPAVRESATAVRAHRFVTVRTARETATALRTETGRGTRIGAARTGAASLPLAVRKAAPVGAAGARERAGEVAASARASLRPAEERGGALPVRAVRTVRLGPAHSRDHATRAQLLRRLLLGGATEGVTATSLSGAALVRVRAASAAERAGAVRHRRTVRLGAARAREHADGAVQLRAAWLGPGRAAVQAGAVRQPFQRRMVRTATVTDRASAVAPARQRPADRLTPTTTGPALSPTTYGPVLRMVTAGPVLIATTTEGGG